MNLSKAIVSCIWGWHSFFSYGRITFSIKLFFLLLWEPGSFYKHNSPFQTSLFLISARTWFTFQELYGVGRKCCRGGTYLWNPRSISKKIHKPALWIRLLYAISLDNRITWQESSRLHSVASPQLMLFIHLATLQWQQPLLSTLYPHKMCSANILPTYFLIFSSFSARFKASKRRR